MIFKGAITRKQMGDIIKLLLKVQEIDIALWK